MLQDMYEGKKSVEREKQSVKLSDGVKQRLPHRQNYHSQSHFSKPQQHSWPSDLFELVQYDNLENKDILFY